MVPCCGHAFGDELVCACGTSWWTHQQVAERCAVEARRSHQKPRGPHYAS